MVDMVWGREQPEKYKRNNYSRKYRRGGLTSILVKNMVVESDGQVFESCLFHLLAKWL